MNITKLFLLTSVGLAAFTLTPTAKAGGSQPQQDVGQRPYYYKSNPEIIYTNPSWPWYRGVNDNVILIQGNRYYRNHRAS